MSHKTLYLRVLNWLLSGLREKFPFPIQHGRGGRLQQLPNKACAFLWSLRHCLWERPGKLSVVLSAVSGAQIKLICFFRVHRFWVTSTSPMQMPPMLHWTPLDSGVQAPGLSPRPPLTKMGAQTPKFRCKCHCLELNLDPVMCYQWLSVNWSVIKGYMLVT